MVPGLTRPAIYGRVVTGVCLVPILGTAPRGLIWSEATTRARLDPHSRSSSHPISRESAHGMAYTRKQQAALARATPAQRVQMRALFDRQKANGNGGNNQRASRAMAERVLAPGAGKAPSRPLWILPILWIEVLGCVPHKPCATPS